MALKMMLVDDHPLFIEGLRYFLEIHGFEVAGVAENGREALEQARLLQPDVVLMDIEMPGGSGLEVIHPLKAALPGVKIVMLTSFDADEKLFEAVKRGASGYLLKTVKGEELLAMLAALARDDAPLSPGLAARLLAEFARQAAEKPPDGPADREEKMSKLSEKQIAVLDLVAQGKTYKEVGVALDLTERTVKYHMERILELLHLENRAQVITYAARERAGSERKEQTDRFKYSSPGEEVEQKAD